ncbi:AMZ2-like protein [Mya arenaria]|uniref:AMZ2-like protein n=1 Tax=Mya arenaria TaxID=6604 RepID=A0ABY7DYX0_MYAAR|nr:AMZ2-like protein [Mya arenaria]
MTFFALLKRLLEAYFDGMTIDILPNVNFHDSKWKIKTRFHHKTNSKQYHVTDFFPKLRSVKPADGYCVLGLSWTDLYPTEKLNFVLGEAHFGFKSAIFCFGRCEPKIYDPETFKDIDEMDAKLLWRIIKVVSHETCHLFGLMHCWYFRCNMNESCSMAEAASQPLFLCPVCLRKLQHACGFDLINRYRRILVILQDIVSVFPSQEIEQSIQWLEKCLKFLLTDKL